MISMVLRDSCGRATDEDEVVEEDEEEEEEDEEEDEEAGGCAATGGAAGCPGTAVSASISLVFCE
jgi:hypothetical protein